MHIGHAQLHGLGLELSLEPPSSQNDDGEVGRFGGFQQVVQPLVVTQRTDEQEKTLSQALTPQCKFFSRWRRVSFSVQPIRHDTNLVLETR
ncbi:hypothetical protein D3C73_1394610 [compost metagenome]